MIGKELKPEQKSSDILFYSKIALSALTAGVCIYLGGPTASTSARFLYDNAYDFQYGIPAFYEPSYWLTYMPMREHLSNVAYQYGPQLAGAIAAPITYKATDSLAWLGKKLSALFKKKAIEAKLNAGEIPTIVVIPCEGPVKDQPPGTPTSDPEISKMTDEELNAEIEKIIEQLKALDINNELDEKLEDLFFLQEDGTYGLDFLYAQDNEKEKEKPEETEIAIKKSNSSEYR